MATSKRVNRRAKKITGDSMATVQASTPKQALKKTSKHVGAKNPKPRVKAVPLQLGNAPLSQRGGD